MNYPDFSDMWYLTEQLTEHSKLKCEYGASQEAIGAVNRAKEAIQKAIEEIKALQPSEDVQRREPNELAAIQALRSDGPRSLYDRIDRNKLADKMEGAILARFAGCTLGAPVEFWSIEDMEEWAKHLGQSFPVTEYWKDIPKPFVIRYGKSPCSAYTQKGMDGVPVDDDITYTVLGLLIAEEYGVDFTVEDVGKAWLKYLPYACTAEDIALKNLKAGVAAAQAGEVNNPYCEWIGADIRSDPWGYICAGNPEKAAELAYKDAYISHRRNGIYGEMFFAAAQAAAFVVDDPIEAIKIGMTEIPADCSLYHALEWALEVGPSNHDYRAARKAVDEKFAGMSGVHTNNNACLTVFGLMMGGTDVTKVLSEIVAMGMDNDCTAATAGSIVGAIVGKSGIPQHWYKNFNNKVETYLNGDEVQEIPLDELTHRFLKFAENQ